MASLINLDLSEAFDRVDLEFVYQVLRRVGVAEGVISRMKMLYRECRSSV